MLLIVGLGNIGKNYDNTYHNIGFMCLDAYLKKYNLELKKKKYDGLFCETVINSNKVIFVKPTTFMNDSGICVQKFKNAFKLKDEEILIICDDYDLEIGTVRFRNSGSAGTHNGLRSIAYELNTQNFKRLKIGIKDTSVNIPLINYVLSKIGTNLEKYSNVFEKTTSFLENYIQNSGKIENQTL